MGKIVLVLCGSRLNACQHKGIVELIAVGLRSTDKPERE